VTVAWCATSSCQSYTVLGGGTTDSSGDFGGSSPKPAVTIIIPSTATKGMTYTIGTEGTTSKAVAKTTFTVTS
ncbi:MAG: hypothetical protein M3Z66_15710, partial [Chloroflexota bacterium]|nr:hypothetical protein [Chloroflexota bacterium]